MEIWLGRRCYLFHVGTDKIRKTIQGYLFATVWTPAGAAGNTYANYLMGYYGKQLLSYPSQQLQPTVDNHRKAQGRLPLMRHMQHNSYRSTF